MVQISKITGESHSNTWDSLCLFVFVCWRLIVIWWGGGGGEWRITETDVHDYPDVGNRVKCLTKSGEDQEEREDGRALRADSSSMTLWRRSRMHMRAGGGGVTAGGVTRVLHVSENTQEHSRKKSLPSNVSSHEHIRFSSSVLGKKERCLFYRVTVL